MTLIEDAAAAAVEGVDEWQFSAVLCHGVLGYLERRPDPVIAQLCRCVAPGGLVSIMAANAHTMAVRPAMEQRWDDALAARDRGAGRVRPCRHRRRAHRAVFHLVGRKS